MQAQLCSVTGSVQALKNWKKWREIREGKFEIKSGLSLSIIEIHVDLYYFGRFVAYDFKVTDQIPK